MKIITVNVPERDLASIEKLVGENSLYPSRSELIRVAVREHLKRILRAKEDQAQLDLMEEKESQSFPIDDENYAHVPIEKIDENGDKVHSFKTYKILRRLEL